jgi:hypothetical protein
MMNNYIISISSTTIVYFYFYCDLYLFKYIKLVSYTSTTTLYTTVNYIVITQLQPLRYQILANNLTTTVTIIININMIISTIFVIIISSTLCCLILFLLLLLFSSTLRCSRSMNNGRTTKTIQSFRW